MEFSKFGRLLAKRRFSTGIFMIAVSLFWSLTGCSVIDRSSDVSEVEFFLVRADELLREVWSNQRRAEWVNDAYRSEDTIALENRAKSELFRVGRELGVEASNLLDSDLPKLSQRRLELLRSSFSTSSHLEPVKQQEFVALQRQLEEFYRNRTFCLEGAVDCLDSAGIKEAFRDSQNTDKLIELWREWRRELPSLRNTFERYVELTNEAAIELGYRNANEASVSFSGMPVENFESGREHLWEQVRPLYESLHCLVRGDLGQEFGTAAVPPKEEIPAHLLSDISNGSSISLHRAFLSLNDESEENLIRSLQREEINSLGVVSLGQEFFNSLGFESLEPEFWSQSIFMSPVDEEDYCAVRAWNVDLTSDLRLKVCARITGENFVDVYRSLSEIYYHRAKRGQDALFRMGADQDLLVALGGAITLSLTPRHLMELGLLEDVDLENAHIAFLVSQALDTIGRTPFGLVVDKWKTQVFSGATPAALYNKSWWDLRRRYEGIRPASPRSDTDFDSGSIRDVLTDQLNTPNLFIDVLKFQTHKTLCQIAGFEGPLSECSIYRSSKAGIRLMEMMAIEAGAPRHRLLSFLSGGRRLDAAALLEYFQPLRVWLDAKNEGRTCGW